MSIGRADKRQDLFDDASLFVLAAQAFQGFFIGWRDKNDEWTLAGVWGNACVT
jgi:hypothetical protein